MASSRGRKGADYCISWDGSRHQLTRHTGCQWYRSARGLNAQPKKHNAGIYTYLYAGPRAVYLLRVQDTFVNRRGDATALVAEGPLSEVWPTFLAYGRMTQ